MVKKILPFFLAAAFILVAIMPSEAHAADDNGVEEFKQEWNDALDEYNQKKKEDKKEQKKENEVKPKNQKQGGVTLLSKRYPSSHYNPIVTDDSGFWLFSSEEIAKSINSISTGFFALNKQLSEIVDASLDSFLALDVIGKVKDTVTEASDELWEVMKEHFAGTLLVIAIVQIFIYYVAERNGMKAGRTALKTALIIIVAFVWVANSGQYLKMLDHWSSQAQGHIMSAGTVLTDDIGHIEEGKEVEGAAALLRNSYFQMTVRRPYLIMNYGTTNENKIEEKAEEGENRIEDMLALKTNEDGNEDRAELAKEEVKDKGNEYMDQSSVWSKFAIAILSTVFTLFLGIPLFILVFFNVLIQFVVLMIAFILPITFIVSILPRFANSGWYSLGRLLSTFIIKIFISILILFVFMIFSIIDVLIPPDNVGAYFLNMTLAGVLIVFMLLKRDKIVEFITAGRVVGVSGQAGAGVARGARRANDMARTGGSHAATKSLTATAGGMALAQTARRGLSKARGNFRNAQSQSNEGQGQGQQTTGNPASNVVSLNQRRDRSSNRTPQGGSNKAQGNDSNQKQADKSDGEKNGQEGNVAVSDNNIADRGQSRNTGGNIAEQGEEAAAAGKEGDMTSTMAAPDSSMSDRSELRNTSRNIKEQTEGETTSDNDNTITPMAVPTGNMTDRNESRHTGENVNEQSEEQSDSNNIASSPAYEAMPERNRSRTHPHDEKYRDQNLQTNGEGTPPKRLTQWEAQKQTEKQKHEGKPHPGRMNRTNRKQGEKPSRTNRTPQDDESRRQAEQPAPSDKQQQSNVPLHKRKKEERKQKRKEKHHIRREANNTTVDKMKNAAKRKRREMVDKRKRRGRK